MGALPALETLILHTNEIGDDGMKALAEACASGALASLETLDMSGNKIGNDGMKAFAKACRAKGGLPQLENVYLAGNLGNEELVLLGKRCF